MSNSLGPQAQCGIITANTQVRSPSFSQPYLVRGSADAPSTTTVITYVSGYNKYIFYFPLVSGTHIQDAFSVNQVPRDLSATYSTTSSVVCVPSGSFSTNPVLSSTHQFQQFPNANFSRTLAVYPISSTAPVFTGTAYMKVVLQFSLD